jgi:hypothetical protein
MGIRNASFVLTIPLGNISHRRATDYFLPAYLFIVYLTALSAAQNSQRPTTELLVNKDLEGMQKE